MAEANEAKKLKKPENPEIEENQIDEISIGALDLEKGISDLEGAAVENKEIEEKFDHENM